MNELDIAVKATLKAVKDVMPENNIRLVYLTGSRLYGYEKETSDYDFKVYVEPTERELVFGKMVSKEVVVNSDKVDSVSIHDVRYLVNELKKPTANSLHLLFEPVYDTYDVDTDMFFCGKRLYNFKGLLDSYVVSSFNVTGRKNLGLSLLGTIKNEKQRDRRPCFLMMAYLLSKDLYAFGFLNEKLVKETGEMVKGVASFDKKFESLEEDLFEKWLEVEQEGFVDYEKLFLQ